MNGISARKLTHSNEAYLADGADAGRRGPRADSSGAAGPWQSARRAERGVQAHAGHGTYGQYPPAPSIRLLLGSPVSRATGEVIMPFSVHLRARAREGEGT